jgi:drug/metabolite transporter (DMT)-like permease
MVNADLVALAALPILAVILAVYLLRVDDNVGHLFMLMGAGLCVIALLPYVFNTPSDIGTILIILGLGCIAWGLSLRKRRFRWKKRRS